MAYISTIPTFTGRDLGKMQKTSSVYREIRPGFESDISRIHIRSLTVIETYWILDQ
jgi:hypothetical protein